MANSKATLSSVWTEDGNQVKIVPVSIIKNTASVGVGTGLENKFNYKTFYQNVGLDKEAKETGLIDPSGSLAGFQEQSYKGPKMIQMVTMPKSGTTEKVYLVKSTNSTQQILPKIIHATQNTTATGTRYITLPTQQVVHMATSPQTRYTPSTALTGADNLWDTVIHKRSAYDLDVSDSKRLKKGGKGLRHFSMKVCEKVQQKVTTTYNEVADELVTEFTVGHNLTSHDMVNTYDQKNIRRRVYDALNVLMAMNIISKEKKEIRWIGLPTNSAQECQLLDNEIKTLRDRTRQKRQQLQELMLQQIAFKNMVKRNREDEIKSGTPALNSAIQLPFIIVNTSKKTVIDCSISNDKYEYLFNFDNTFEIHDDIEVLKRMGMAYNLDKGMCTSSDLSKALKMVPESLKPYVVELAKSNPLPGTSGIRPPPALPSNVLPSTRRPISPLAMPLPHHDSDAEVAMVTGSVSRASSTASYTGTSQTGTTPSECLSDSDDSDCSSPVDVL